MKSWFAHIVLVVIFAVQSSAAIAMATHMQTQSPHANGQATVSHIHAETDKTPHQSHCQHHALQIAETDHAECQHCAQNDCSHCHCISSLSGVMTYIPFIANASELTQHIGFSARPLPDTPPQRILRPPRFIA